MTKIGTSLFNLRVSLSEEMTLLRTRTLLSRAPVWPAISRRPPRRTLHQASNPSHPPTRVIFSGIQPSGIPHIGNYIGALQHWVKLSKEAQVKEDETGERTELYFSIVGLHAITLPRDPAKLRRERFEMMCVLLAIGLDPERCCLFNQDQVPAHSEMAWILNCIAPVGRLNRMTTWKAQIASSKNSNSLAEVDESMLHLGLLAYPVLQSADILLYQSTHVPVGEDQVQHLELTKVLAKSLNHQFAQNLFPIPTAMFTPQSKILNLRNPTMKMSKSNPSEQTRVMVTDGAEAIAKKIKGAVTDSVAGVSYDASGRAGVSNLIDIYAAISGLDRAEILHAYRARSVRDLKLDLIDRLVAHLAPFQARYLALLGNPAYVHDVFLHGAQRAARVADRTLQLVKSNLGLA